ncbi:MAG: Gfo/Idh/MocA family oxidoreductase, partial [Candidatus Aerophobetes bacterium]|nr:Gfo/Idh/MocA family oxidoreductase [Candidatus Aerophobetes bacterium]
MIKAGLVGCGVIGTEIARAIDEKIPQMKLVAICDRNRSKEEKLKHSLRIKPESINLEGVIKAADLVIEAVSPQIAGELARKVIENGKDIMIMSVGGMVDYLYLFDEAR